MLYYVQIELSEKDTFIVVFLMQTKKPHFPAFETLSWYRFNLSLCLFSHIQTS